MYERQRENNKARMRNQKSERVRVIVKQQGKIKSGEQKSGVIESGVIESGVIESGEYVRD